MRTFFMYKLLSMLLLLLSVFQEVLPMRSVAQRSLLRSAQAYKAQITRPANLQRMQRRNLTGFEPIIIAGTAANPVVLPLAACCIGTGVACKIAWELYRYGTSETYKRLFGPKQHLHNAIERHLQEMCDAHGHKYIEPWQEGLPAWMINQDLYSEARNPDFKKLTNGEARKQAETWKYTEQKPAWDTHGELAFRNKRGNQWISPDNTGHRGKVWKVLDRDGEIITCWDKDGNDMGK
jgi:hypothetical protein